MHAAGARADPSNQGSAMPVTDDEIREKYLERAIRELNELTRDLQECEHCPRGNLMPVLGSGHPRADVVLLKHSPRTAEVEEGVAFYGRSGNAITKSLNRLSIDPLVVYGTLCVKCPLDDPSLAGGECIGRLVEELMIIEPRVIVVMGEPALETLNELGMPLSRPLGPQVGQLQSFTPTVDALFTPDIDESLDSDAAKREFWQAFRVLGEWYSDLPPY